MKCLIRITIDWLHSNPFYLEKEFNIPQIPTQGLILIDGEVELTINSKTIISYDIKTSEIYVGFNFHLPANDLDGDIEYIVKNCKKEKWNIINKENIQKVMKAVTDGF